LSLAESDLEALQVCADREVGYPMCRGKLAEVLEKILKAELIRLGWFLVKTHDIELLAGELRARGSDLMAEVDSLCEALAEAYFASRYPGFDVAEPNWPDLRRHINLTVMLAARVRGRLSDQSVAPL
jgi:HEPN domain-containing protein